MLWWEGLSVVCCSERPQEVVEWVWIGTGGVGGEWERRRWGDVLLRISQLGDTFPVN